MHHFHFRKTRQEVVQRKFQQRVTPEGGRETQKGYLRLRRSRTKARPWAWGWGLELVGRRSQRL